MHNNSKKAIGPVIATALLLVVAVVAAVGFNTWFGTYSSQLNSKIESDSSNSLVITIERLEAAAVDTATSIYLRNKGSLNQSITSLKVVKNGITYCSNSSTVNIDENAVSVYPVNCGGGALVSGTSYNVLVIYGGGIVQASQIARS